MSTPIEGFRIKTIKDYTSENAVIATEKEYRYVDDLVTTNNSSAVQLGFKPEAKASSAMYWACQSGNGAYGPENFIFYYISRNQ